MGGVVAAKFTDVVQTAFKESIVAGDYGITLTTEMIEISSFFRRDMSVAFKVYTGTTSATDLTAAKSKMSSYLSDTSSTGFSSTLNAKAAAAGSNFQSTGVTVNSFAAGAASGTSGASTSSSGLSGGAVAGIVIACVVVVAIIAGIVGFFVMGRKHHATDGTVIVKDAAGNEDVWEGTSGSGNQKVIDDRTVQL